MAAFLVDYENVGNFMLVKTDSIEDAIKMLNALDDDKTL
jgi:hypothetical protein